MDPLVDLHPLDPTVAPGSDARVSVGIRNPGSVQTEYEVTVVGPTSAYATVNPSHVKVNPRGAAHAEVTFLPRRDPSTTTGRIPFGVKVESLEGDGATVAEGDLTVGDFTELAVRLVPTMSRGRWKGRHKLVIDNGGTARQVLQVRPDEDSEIDLSFAFTPDPSSVVVGAGQKAEIFVVVRAKHPALVGKREPLPFTLMVEEPSRRVRRESIGRSVKGTFMRRQILSKGVLLLGAGAAALTAWGITSVDADESFTEAESTKLDTPLPVTVQDAGAGELRATWSTVQGATAYRLDARDLDPIDDVAPEESSVLLGAAEGLQVDTEYCFRVTAIGDAEGGLADSEASADGPASCGTPLEATIEPPDLLSADWIDGSLLVTWTKLLEGEVVVEIDGEEAVRSAADSGRANVSLDDHPNPLAVAVLKLYLEVGDQQSEKVPPDGLAIDAAPVPATSVAESTPPSTTGVTATSEVIATTAVPRELVGILGVPSDLDAEGRATLRGIADRIETRVRELALSVGADPTKVRVQIGRAPGGGVSFLMVTGLPADLVAEFCRAYGTDPPVDSVPAITTTTAAGVASPQPIGIPDTCDPQMVAS